VRIRAGLRVLDVGCGGGSFLRVIKELGAVTFGVETSPDATQVARGQGLEVFNGTLEDFAGNGKAGEPFDLITFSQVVEHLPDPIRTLSLTPRFLAPGGMVWLSVPNGACNAARQLGWRWHSTDLPIHLHHFSIESMKIAAEHAGLAPERIYTFSLPSSVRGSMLSALRTRWRIPARVATALLSDARVARRAADLDARAAGEAIIAELRLR
jgi:SAM-dependent methyltransferase